jgi:hypothetical protein
VQTIGGSGDIPADRDDLIGRYASTQQRLHDQAPELTGGPGNGDRHKNSSATIGNSHLRATPSTAHTYTSAILHTVKNRAGGTATTPPKSIDRAQSVGG